MKPSPTPTRPRRTRREQGIALVTVLAILTLTAVLVMAFFTVSRSELASSTVYSRGVEASHLSKSAVDMVIHQIRSATDRKATAWASQPGMIRTWEGESRDCYKLYSDDKMVVSEDKVFDDFSELRAWRDDARFVDLNAPVIRTYDTRTEYFFPIIDPRAAIGDTKVEGFDVNWDPVGVAAKDKPKQLPMPVRWIYQLEDGTLGTLAGSGQTGQFQPLAGQGGGGGGRNPSASNPIVARFAFWTDDETAKLNVNTAAGGVAWDTPRAGGVSDRAYGMFQPVANEFQRYPGHPATTSMIHVLFPRIPLPNSERYDRNGAEAYYDLVPRVQGGGSRGGGFAGTPDRYGLITPIQPDDDRLYATIDEFIFSAPRVGRSDGRTSPKYERKGHQKITGWPELKPEDLGRLQFFLTATSKAPEVTIFNTPRISVWPSFHGDPERGSHTRYFTSYDRRLRFCAEVGKRDESASNDSRAPKDVNRREPAMYHFQRKNAASCTADYEDIPRNRELYGYLQEMMAAPVPGLDVSDGVKNWGSLRDKYGQRNTNQIITEVFDYVRSLNLFDDLLVKQHGIEQITTSRLPSAPVAISRNFVNNGYYGYWAPSGPNVGEHPTFTPGRLAVYSPPDTTNGHAAYIGSDAHSGHGQVAPIRINPPGTNQETKGFGRFFSVREVGVAILACAQDNGWPLGESRRGVGMVRGGPVETWSSQGKVIGPPPQGGEVDPEYDYSNVPPLSQTSRQHVFNTYNLGQWNVRDPNNGQQRPIEVGDLNDNSTVMFPSRPEMTGAAFYNYVVNQANWNRTLAEDTPLKNRETQVQAILLVSLFCPSKGWTMINPDFRFEMEVPQDFQLQGQFLGFPNAPANLKTPHAGFRRVWHGRDSGGILEPRMLMLGHGRVKGNPRADQLAYSILVRSTPAALNAANFAASNVDTQTFNKDVEKPSTNQLDADPSEGQESYVYPWVSNTMTIPGVPGENGMMLPKTMTLGGGRVIIRLFPDGGSRTDLGDQTAGREAIENDGAGDYSQKVDITFATTEVPLPILAGAAYGHRVEGPSAGMWRVSPGTEVRPREHWCWNRDGAFKVFPPPVPGQGRNNGLFRGRLQLSTGAQGYSVPTSPVDETPNVAFSGHGVVRPVDVVRSYVIPHGDDRIVAPLVDVPSSIYQPHQQYGNPNRLVASNFSIEASNSGYGREGLPPNTPGLNEPNPPLQTKALVNPTVANVPATRRPLLPENFEQNMNQWGDWDNGVAGELDGPLINKPDEGNAMGVAYNDYVPKPWISNSPARAFIPYFTDSWVQEPAGPGLWSPNRIMPGPGMFGSLPTGVYSKGGTPVGEPWQTLLFRRIGGSNEQSAQGKSPLTGRVHPGWEHPRDHYLLDFFWMPVVEPYSISEPLATAGKINMNYAIQPFDYIKRKSSLLGVFSSEELLTVPNRLLNGANAYKDGEGWGSGYTKTTHSGGSLRNVSLRSWISLNETLRQFDDLFGSPGGSTAPQVFRTASQICEQWLVPGKPVAGNPYGVSNITLEQVSQWYNPEANTIAGQKSFGLVGDNARERPYTNLVARLTTKSNTYNVHYRAQIIRQSPLSPSSPGQRRTDSEYGVFNAASDKMVGEYRGSSIIERYIDPNDVRIPDYASEASKGDLQLGNSQAEVDTLDKFYRFRVVSEKRFAP